MFAVTTQKARVCSFCPVPTSAVRGGQEGGGREGQTSPRSASEDPHCPAQAAEGAQRRQPSVVHGISTSPPHHPTLAHTAETSLAAASSGRAAEIRRADRTQK